MQIRYNYKISKIVLKILSWAGLEAFAGQIWPAGRSLSIPDLKYIMTFNII